MKSKSFFAGLLLGTLIFGGTTAYAAGVIAQLSTQPIYVDGQQVSMTAYSIGGNNYVKLRDIGEKVGFNVYWDNATKSVQVRSDAPYAEEETLPVKSEIPTPEAPTMDAHKKGHSVCSVCIVQPADGGLHLLG